MLKTLKSTQFMNEFKHITRCLFLAGIIFASSFSANGQNSTQLDQGQIYGYVTNCYTGDSLENVEVKAKDSINEITGQTNSNGYYSLLLDPAIYELTFQLEGYINDTIPDIEVLPSLQTEINKSLCDFPYPVDSVWAEFNEDSTQATIYWLPPIVSGLEVTRYIIFKMQNFDPNIGEGPEDGTATGIGAASQSPKNDYGGGGLHGFFGYAVEAIYNDTIHSTFSFSNILIGGMSRNVFINAQLCCDDICDDIEVNIIGYNYPYQSLSELTNTECNTVFEEVIYGYYDILFHKDGYQDIILDSVFIYSDTSFAVVMEENLIPPPPTNLIIDPLTLKISWEEPATNKQVFLASVPNTYKIYLNSVVIAELPNTVFEYTFENLNYGQEYSAKVRAQYDSTLSSAATVIFISRFLYPVNSLYNNYLYGTDSVTLFFKVPTNEDLEIPNGLISFNVYSNNSLIGNIIYSEESITDTISFTQYNLSPGNYTYQIGAVYNLETYGFPGEAAESMLITTDSITVEIIGINDLFESRLVNIFPNPATKAITISSEKEINTIEVYSLNGEKLQSNTNINSKKYEMDVSRLLSGTYILKIEIDKINISRKLIIGTK